MLFLGAAGFIGCKKKTEKQNYEPGVFVENIEKKINEMGPDDVLVSVNGEKLTVERYNRLLKQYEMELILRHRNARDSKVQVKLGMDWKRKSAVEEFVDRQVVLEEAERMNLEPSSENVRKVSKYAEMVQKASGINLEKFCENLGYTPDEYRMKQKQDALRMTLRDRVFTNDLSATEHELELEKERYAAYNQECEATNKVVKAHAERIVRQLREGADFKELAKRYTEAPETQDIIEELTRSQIYEPEVEASAFSLPVGAVSDPIDTESGLYIIKVFERNEITAEDAASGERSTVKMGSVLLKLGQYFPCPSEPDLRNFITNEKQKYVLRQYLDELREKCRIEYPNGTNFWKKTENKGPQ
ncbi:MAG: peptidylprolyl isomerase [Kiritimatiellia bacterium]